MSIDGLSHEQTFCPLQTDPHETVEWTKYDAVIENPQTGETVFEQRGVMFPESWSQQSVNIVASKYFFGDLDAENGNPVNGKREYHLGQLVDRVADTIVDQGIDRGYFAFSSDAQAFRNDLKWLLLHQHFAFNSPVWFNVGLGQAYGVKEGDEQNLLFNQDSPEENVQEVDPYLRPQAAACFIIDIPDDIDGIWDAMKESARLFKFGSGVGSNWSSLRSSKENVSGGGTASGPVSFMRVQDATGATIKSGGKTRRSAIMQILNSSHPDIEDFIDVKREEEKKAHALIEEGYDSSFNGEAYATADFQDVNQSVKVDEEFFELIEASEEEKRGFEYELEYVDQEGVHDTVDPRDLLNRIAENTWECGDPGMQYDGEIQRWHTCKETDKIRGSNPCSEFLFLDNTACNLASINFRKIEKDGGGWDSEKLQDIAEIAFVSQDILCDFAGYPSEEIAEMSENFRPLGLGFANLGASLMAHGIPYDSKEGRAIASALQANVHFAAYNASTKMAKQLRPYPGYEENQEHHDEVMDMHIDTASDLYYGNHDYLNDVAVNGNVMSGPAEGLMYDALKTAEEMRERGMRHGYRNSQATVIAPTGTISFYMGCTTTGIEPSPALVQYKNLAGDNDSQIKIVNDAVGEALESLGYTDQEITEIEDYIQENDTIEGAPHIEDEDLEIFDCAIAPFNGERSIDPRGHVDMMAGVQPFVSGAISKTVNLPEDSTVEDIEDAYRYGWEKGLKALAIYRDGSKMSQAVSTTDGSEESDEDSDDDHLGETIEEAEDDILPDGDEAIHEGIDDDAFNEGQEAGAALLKVKGMIEQGDITATQVRNLIGVMNEPLSCPSCEELTIRELVQEAVQSSDFREVMLVLDNMMDHEISGAHVKAEVADDSTGANRRKLPDKAPSVRKKFRVGQVEGYIHVGLYPDSRKPGEVFITVSKEGSTLAGVMDSFATALSLALQYGVPLEDLVEKFKNQRFEPSGFTGDEIQSATSIVDYVAKWLEHHFLKATDSDGDENVDWMDESENFDSTKTTSRTTFEEDHALSTNGATDGKDDPRSEETYRDTSGEETSGKVCHNCGSQMQRDGTCYVCPVCGEDTGCGG